MGVVDDIPAFGDTYLHDDPHRGDTTKDRNRNTPVPLKGAGGRREISQFGALAMSLASTIGTGNIIGVGTAIALGGPGAVLWCWLTGYSALRQKYSEALLAVKYRVKTGDGRMQGGAMYVLERGLHMKGMALLFAFWQLCLSGDWLCNAGQCHCSSVQGESWDRAGGDRDRSGSPYGPW